MFASSPRLPLVILVACLPLLLAACFRDTSETINQQPVAQVQATATAPQADEPTAAPTATDEPTAQPQQVDEFALSATALIAQQTQQAAQPADAPAVLTQVGAPALQPLVRATIPPGEDCVHEIRVGDTLFQLSLAYGVTVDAISRASGIANPDVISVGQKITIPECGTLGFIPPPTSVPTATADPNLVAPTAAPEQQEIAAVDNPRSALIEQAQAVLLTNAQADAEFSAQAVAPRASGRTYTVQPNDTLLLIALRFGTSIEVLAALNNIIDIDSLNAGQELQLP